MLLGVVGRVDDSATVADTGVEWMDLSGRAADALASAIGHSSFLAEWRSVFQERRDLCLERLRAMDGIDCVTPDGAFYLFPS